MRLRRVRIRNFRCFKDEVEFEVEDFVALVGRNDAGKSTVLDALALFFDEYKPDADDASMTGDKSDMTVICEFDELPEELEIDAGFRTSLRAEWMLNARGFLEIHRVFNGALKTPKQSRSFLLADHPSAEGRSDLLYLRNAQLKTRARELGIDLSGVDQRINCALRRAIWGSDEDLQLSEQEIDIDREDAKRIWALLKKQLPIFVVFKSDRESTDQDAEAQDPLKSAVQEALQAQQSQLEQVTAMVKEQVLSIARTTVRKLSEMDPTLAQELNPRFAEPNWSKVFNISLTDDSQVPINKRGSGVRRLILLNFFRAQAEKRLESSESPGIIYAIEEPETGQHPCNQEMLFSSLRELSEQPGCQVMITTHTPVLVRNLPLTSLKYIKYMADGRRQVMAGTDETYKQIAATLGVIPDNNVRFFIGVEGINDIEFLRNISKVLHDAGENVLDLNSLESAGELIFIPLGGSSLTVWTHRLSHLNKPEFHLFDRDEQPSRRSRHQDVVDDMNQRERVRAMLTSKREMENYLSPDAIHAALGVTVEVNDFSDVPDLVAEQVHLASGSPTPWDSMDPEKKRRKVSKAKKRLNSEVVLAMTPELLSLSDQNGDVREWLAEIKRFYELEMQTQRESLVTA